ncbi:hypothetical protein LCGC14_2800350, partial [marine sediment metagenome]
GTHKYVAAKLGISDTHWNDIRGSRNIPQGVDISAISAAIKRGCSLARSKVQGYLMKHAKNNVIGAIFLAKQEHLLDYKDQRSVEQTGQMEVIVTHRVLPPVESKVIEHEDYEEIENE